MSTPTLTPAGWYPDPHGLMRQRYWDGIGWLEGSRCLNGHETPGEAAFCPTCGTMIGVRAAGGPSGQTAQLAASPDLSATPDATTLEQTAHPVPTRSRVQVMIVAGVVLAVVATAGVLVWRHSSTGSSLPFVGPAKTAITGTFILTDSDTANAGCTGQGGYSDISAGVSVILTNQDGKILGASTLGSGTPDTNAGTCTYTFSVPDIPMDQDQYAVEVSHRGKIVDSKTELAAADWSFNLSMGS